MLKSFLTIVHLPLAVQENFYGSSDKLNWVVVLHCININLYHVQELDAKLIN